MKNDIWSQCLQYLEQHGAEQNLCSENDFNTWIRPLQVDVREHVIVFMAPNTFAIDWIKQHFLSQIQQLLHQMEPARDFELQFLVGSNVEESDTTDSHQSSTSPVINHSKYGSLLNRSFTFDNFVKGKSNEFAFAAAQQASAKPGEAYNPLLIYGDVGLGKTHLANAIGNEIAAKSQHAKVLYLSSERFVNNMIKALQSNTIEEFKRVYRTVDVLVIDDIQFLAGKDRSQEEFFHTFNALIEDHKQIVLTCDRFPKEIPRLEERLQSRFGWGLTVAIEPPELETRVAILISKAEKINIKLDYDVAFFIAKRIRSNVRELEGALKRVIANADFTGNAITLDFVKDTLRDLITLQDKLVTVENIKRVVAEYYKIKITDLLSKTRLRQITRARQMAMALARELTDRSLPEIGNAFGGKDHTTVLHACRKMSEWFKTDVDLQEDYNNLLRILTG